MNVCLLILSVLKNLTIHFCFTFFTVIDMATLTYVMITAAAILIIGKLSTAYPLDSEVEHHSNKYL